MNETKKSILLVEDDQKLAKAIAARLTAGGYEVKITHDGVSGLQVAQGDPPDLIIADIFMPIGAGFAMAYRLRQAASNVPIVFMTGSKDPALRKSAKGFGAAGFVEKPYEASRLLRLVGRVLGPAATIRRLSSKLPAAKTARKNRKRILIVEDDRKIALGLSIRLQAAGYDVTLADDALNGAKAAEILQPDLLLLDVTMPGGGGFSVAERVRKLLPQSIPIVFLTANKQPRLRRMAEQLGSAGFFEKPYDSRLLLATIHDVLNQSSSGSQQ